MLPTLVLGAIFSDSLPESWQFRNWPEEDQGLFKFLMYVFLVADLGVTIWYLERTTRDKPSDDPG